MKRLILTFKNAYFKLKIKKKVYKKYTWKKRYAEVLFGEKGIFSPQAFLTFGLCLQNQHKGVVQLYTGTLYTVQSVFVHWYVSTSE